MKILFFALIALSTINSAKANTWHVEKNGSGDFTIIQDAVNAAASGDTIRIGPGLYDEIHVMPVPFETETAIVHVLQQELTIIGSSSEDTIIGQDHLWDVSQGIYPRGIHGGVALGNDRLRVENVCIQNLYHGVLFQGGGKFTLSNCRILGSRSDLALYTPSPVLGDEVLIEDCFFDLSDMTNGARHIWSHDQDLLVIRNCQFKMVDILHTTHIGCSGRQAVIDNCEFHYGRVGVASTCDNMELSDCYFDGQNYYGLSIEWGLTKITDSHFKNQYAAMYLYPYHGEASLEASRVTFESASNSTLKYNSLGSGFINNCILAKGEQYVVRGAQLDKADNTAVHFDMTNNWWGTTDPDSIQAWIYDGVDSPLSDSVIDWEPFLGQQVPVEKQSLGGIRAMFRNEDK